MKELTRERAIELHREMWHRIADRCRHTYEPVEKDHILLDMKLNPGDILWECFLCHYAYEAAGRVIETRCLKCPLKWPGEFCVRGGLYAQFMDAQYCMDWDRAAELAKQIAELPERSEVRGT